MNTNGEGRPGIDAPDARGRTGLDRAGRDLTRNPDVNITDVELVAAGWHVLRTTTFDYRRRDGSWTRERRETYDRGNGACVLLYDADRRSVLLTRQFRYPAYVNGHEDGMLVEVAAGLLDEDDPETAVRREAEEETGVRIGEVQHVLDAYMSPGSVTERMHFYAAPYGASLGAGEGGGGIAEEGEDIEVLELPFADALAGIRSGEIADAKTILLLQWAALDGPFAGAGADASGGGAARVGAVQAQAERELPETD
jgi:nudix-type nucleoside diphosphatase (YffH/AdpP family)